MIQHGQHQSFQNHRVRKAAADGENGGAGEVQFPLGIPVDITVEVVGRKIIHRRAVEKCFQITEFVLTEGELGDRGQQSRGPGDHAVAPAGRQPPANTSKSQVRSTLPSAIAACSMVSSYRSVNSPVEPDGWEVMHRPKPGFGMVFRGRLQECQNGVVVGEDAMTRTGSTYGMTMTAPAPEKTEVVDPVTAADVPWVTIVWNDPVNLMSYVTWCSRSCSVTQAQGRGADDGRPPEGPGHRVDGPREKMEADVAKLQGAGLWATMAQDR